MRMRLIGLACDVKAIVLVLARERKAGQALVVVAKSMSTKSKTLKDVEIGREGAESTIII